MKARFSILLLLFFSMLPAQGEADYGPMIVLYAGGNQELAEMLAELIRADSRIESRVEIVSSAAAVAMATVLPTTECLVMYCDHKDQIKGLEPGIGKFLAEGGGLVGITEVCYEPSAEKIALDIFPVGANSSVIQRNPTVKRVRNYQVVEGGEIAAGLPAAFELLSMGMYLRGDEDGNYIEYEGGGRIAYRDGETGAPLVVTLESEKGGRSVALPGVMVVKLARVDVYYGKLIADENFAKLFTNCVLWAAKGSTRYDEISPGLSQKIDDAKTRYEVARKETERSKRERSTTKMAILIGVWAVGLIVCGVIVVKVVLTPEA